LAPNTQEDLILTQLLGYLLNVGAKDITRSLMHVSSESPEKRQASFVLFGVSKLCMETKTDDIAVHSERKIGPCK
jgi:hypothetical protein